MESSRYISDRLRSLICRGQGLHRIPATECHMNGLIYSNDWFVYEKDGQITFDFGSIGNTCAQLAINMPIAKIRYFGDDAEKAHLLEQLYLLGSERN